MRNTSLNVESAEHDAAPIRLIITYRAGISLGVDLAIPARQQSLLQLLAACSGCMVPDKHLYELVYDAANPEASAAALAADMRELDEALSRMVLPGVLERTPEGGCRLSTDRALISLPR